MVVSVLCVFLKKTVGIRSGGGKGGLKVREVWVVEGVMSVA